MRKAELLKTTEQKFTIRNNSPRTIKSYLSSIKHFSDWLIRNEVKSVTEDLLEKYLYELKRKGKRYVSSMKQTVASIKFIFPEVLNEEIPGVLNMRFRREEKSPLSCLKKN